MLVGKVQSVYGCNEAVDMLNVEVGLTAGTGPQLVRPDNLSVLGVQNFFLVLSIYYLLRNR